ncbi:uncharacterized protein HD556DRAFT_1503211 [Suillus plorans]|uniref:Uncharacterized protein n=1 Tax=Suillus plorans TaxID=116603 RepID=A0A9P7DR50_9AGAM|nr:uncharacterized protein HD556DRAFT_1503211 [Suillus plorans]KAG1801036.1 hypothetical protein HD556DRAFT_1503211 [Suillus plorans]
MVAPPNPLNIITALTSAFKSQNGKAASSMCIAQLLKQNMGQLGKLMQQGKLTAIQIQQRPKNRTEPDFGSTMKDYAEKHKFTTSAALGSRAGTSTTNGTGATATTATAFKNGSPAPPLTSMPGDRYPISQTLNTTNLGPVQWAAAQQGRPTLTGGMTSGRVSGESFAGKVVVLFDLEDNQPQRKNTPGDQSMRYCQLAKHCSNDTLKVKDLSSSSSSLFLYPLLCLLEHNHNISLSQAAVTPSGATAAGKKKTQGTSMTLCSHHLAQVQQAKRESKLASW